MERNPKASLSPQEVATLRGLRQNPKREVADRHRRLLVSMGLAVADGDALKLSDAGEQRLAREERIGR